MYIAKSTPGLSRSSANDVSSSQENPNDVDRCIFASTDLNIVREQLPIAVHPSRTE